MYVITHTGISHAYIHGYALRDPIMDFKEMNQLAVVACYQSPSFIPEYCDSRDVISIVSSSHCHSAILASEKEGMC